MTGSVSDFAYLGLYLPAEHGLLAVVLWGEHQHQIRHSSPTSVGLDLWVDLLLLLLPLAGWRDSPNDPTVHWSLPPHN